MSHFPHFQVVTTNHLSHWDSVVVGGRSPIELTRFGCRELNKEIERGSWRLGGVQLRRPLNPRLRRLTDFFRTVNNQH